MRLFPGRVSSVCGLSFFCSVLKYWFWNEKQEMRSSYASQQYLNIIPSCFRAAMSGAKVPHQQLFYTSALGRIQSALLPIYEIISGSGFVWRRNFAKFAGGDFVGRRRPGTNCIKICLPGKLILSKRKGLREVIFSWKYYLRIDFLGRPIFIQLPPARDLAHEEEEGRQYPECGWPWCGEEAGTVMYRVVQLNSTPEIEVLVLVLVPGIQLPSYLE